MNLTVGAVCSGFEITRVRQVEELSAQCVEMRHKATGAELVWFNSGAENKLFSIAFKTIPENSTGVFHILEHSVLCGSENFPVKEPFVELLKSSLNTFLNAMTFPDKTVYPVSSRNEKDFINLTRVYLDAVFKPAILTNPSIFYQEGWHYELDDEGGAPSYNGVVYNEMKGVYSSVDRVLNMELYAQLFPDTCYGLSSGGEPVHIPELTYEEFVDTYRRFYHPSNARIFLDGDLPIGKMLEMIDGEYLSAFEGRKEPARLELQQPISSRESECSYEIGADESPENRTQMAMGKVICDWSDRVRQLAFYALGDYLTDSNDSPLKKAILEAGLGEDVSMSIDDGTQQPVAYLMIRNTSRDRSERISEVITETAQSLLRNGLDRGSLEASINRVEFMLRDGNEPMGLERAINALSSWLYGGDPLLYLTQNEVFAELRAKLDGDYFEKLLSELLIEKENTATVWCVPSNILGEERLQAEKQRAEKAAAAWTDSEREAVAALNSALEKWQQTPDSAENIARLPVLDLSDVDSAPTERVTIEEKTNGITILRHPSETKGVAYISLYFNIADIDPKNIPAVSLISKLLGELPTARFTAAGLSREIKTHIGSLEFSVKPMSRRGQLDCCQLYFVVRCSLLEEELDNAAAIIAEVLTSTHFDGIGDICTHIAQRYDRCRRVIIGHGHIFAMTRALAASSADSQVGEGITGYDYYDYLRSLSEGGEESAAEFAAFAAGFIADTFCTERMTVSITSGSDLSVDAMINSLPKGKPAGCSEMHPQLPAQRSECIRIPAAVSFGALGVNVYALGSEYSAALSLMAHIVSYDYLWNSIRVQGGAYGAGLRAGSSGSLCFYTYRDPNASRSLGVMRSTVQFLREFCRGDEPLDKSVIGCISNLDPLVSVKERGIAADGDWFRGVTHAVRCRIWRDLLAADREKLSELCDLMEQMAQAASVCVIGGSDIIDACTDEQLTELNY